jgi:peptidylprolyl isomerase
MDLIGEHPAGTSPDKHEPRIDRRLGVAGNTSSLSAYRLVVRIAPVSEPVVIEQSVAKAGDTVEVHYVGVAYSTGEEFDASWNHGAPLQFQLGVGQVIAGWDQGVQGMKVGGRRQLIIPPGLAYGERGAGRAIAPGETLIFVCDLVST